MNNGKTLGIQSIGRNSKNNASQINLFLRLTVEGRIAEFSLKKFVKKISWNQARGISKGSSPDSNRLNFFLEELRSMVVSKYHELMLKDEPFPVENLKDLILGEEENELSLKGLIGYHQEVMASILKPVH